MVWHTNEIFTTTLAQFKIAHIRRLIAVFISLLFISGGYAQSQQKVAVVLSGGGASAYAHIGFLRALEENEIPIDYISGASMGAIIGGLYSAGYTLDEIEAALSSSAFLNEVQGVDTDFYTYHFKSQSPNPSWIDYKFQGDVSWQNNLPTHLIDPIFLDFELMRLCANKCPSENSFDSLFVPFRCVAADIAQKKSIVFKSGVLSEAIRASSTYPFYVRPLVVNDQLLFDGGLYNNFPADVAVEAFKPDVVLGCNVSYNYEKPSPDDLLSQVKNMLVSSSDYSIKGAPGMVITPNDEIGTFDFWNFQSAVDNGYQATLSQIDSIKTYVNSRRTVEELALNRTRFNDKKQSLYVSKLKTKGLNNSQNRYLKKALLKKEINPSLSELRSEYLSLKSDPFIEFVYTRTEGTAVDSLVNLDMDVILEKPFSLGVGGNLSNKSINTGFISLEWHRLGTFGLQVMANTYFGKYYSSAALQTKFFLEGKVPLSIEPYFILNRWDYFKSRISFFDDVKPAFVIENEGHTGIQFETPLNKKSSLVADAKYLSNRPSYYLNSNFTNSDTADRSNFDAIRFTLGVEKNSLNHKQYANQGALFSLKVSYTEGKESYTPGSTSVLDAFEGLNKSWLELRLNFVEYIPISNKLISYPSLRTRLATFHTFSNLTATKIFQPQFNPLTESATLYLPNYRSLNYIAPGVGLCYKLSESFQLRTEHHLFQPLNELEARTDNTTTLGRLAADRFYIGSFATVYNSPLGPISLNFNYYDRSTKPWSIMLNMGYILFNRRSL